jgi:PPP family 3-phenylpropionic acid transporter
MSYALFCLYLGWQVAKLGLETYLITHLITILAEILLILTFPTFHARPRPAAGEGPQPQSVFQLLRSNPRFTLMLAAVCLGITSYMPTTNYLINILVSRGGGSEHLGAALFWMASWELPSALIFPKLYRRYGSSRVMILSMAAIGIKAALLLASPSYQFIFLFLPTQILGYGLFTPDSVFFVNESVPAADRVRGQSMMMVASNGLGGMLGSLLPGAVLDWAGVNAMLAFCVLTGGLSALLAFLSHRMKPAAAS